MQVRNPSEIVKYTVDKRGLQALSQTVCDVASYDPVVLVPVLQNVMIEI